MKEKKNAVVDKTRCVACGTCEKECPLGAIQVFRGCYASVSREICVGCGKCEKVCPACVISIKGRE